MKQTARKVIVAGATMLLLGAPAIVSAHEGHDHGAEGEGSATSSPSPKSERQQKFEQELRDKLERMKQDRQEAQTAIKEKVATLKQKLDDGKKRICEKHEAKISSVMSNMNERRQKAFDRITQVTESVQLFATTKELTIANYDDLVAKVAAAKTAAETAMAAQQAVPKLDCSGDHPRADVSTFKEKRSSSIDAMKAYRDAAKELVKAVKVAAEALKTSTENGGA